MAIGIPDGIRVPLIVITALHVAGSSTAIVVQAGMLAIATGAATMGIGAYFTTQTEREHFNADIKSKNKKERAFLSNLDINEEVQDIASVEIIKENNRWSEWVEKDPDANRALLHAAAIMFAYLAGGIIPLLPFILAGESKSPFTLSILLTFPSLFIAGFIKSSINAINPWAGAFRILAFTVLAAISVYGVALLIKN